MAEQQRPIHDAQSLDERLRVEARESRPEFSEELYASTCRAVRQHAAQKSRPAANDAPSLAGWRRILATTVAASLFAAAAITWQGWHKASPRPVVQDDGIAPDANPAPSAIGASLATANLDALAALVDRTAQRLDSLVNPATQWADLDHDARLAVETFTDRLPIRQVSSRGQSEWLLFQ